MDQDALYVKNYDGYWGPVTATLDWCEGNYDTCFFIAEFYNTVTNAAIILLGILGIYQCRRIRLGLEYELAFSFLCMVGMGSWLFHSTLLYWMQMLDELPMIYATLYLTFLIFEIDHFSKPELCEPDSAHSRILCRLTRLVWSRRARYPFLPLLLFGVGLSFSLVYTGFHINPLFHQFAYASCVFLLLFRSTHIVKHKVKDRAAKKTLFSILAPGALIFGLGFAVWNLDNLFCHQLAYVRSLLIAPFDGILQLHGWWHIFTAIGSYSFVLFCSYLRVTLAGISNVKLTYFFGGLIPYLHLEGKASKRKSA